MHLFEASLLTFQSSSPGVHTIVLVQHVSMYVFLLFQNLNSGMHVFCLSTGIEARS
jgi:hypothetical protein